MDYLIWDKVLADHEPGADRRVSQVDQYWQPHLYQWHLDKLRGMDIDWNMKLEKVNDS